MIRFSVLKLLSSPAQTASWEGPAGMSRLGERGSTTRSIMEASSAEEDFELDEERHPR